MTVQLQFMKLCSYAQELPPVQVVVALPTGSGKTHIAVRLIQRAAQELQAGRDASTSQAHPGLPSRRLAAVFLAPTVALSMQVSSNSVA